MKIQCQHCKKHYQEEVWQIDDMWLCDTCHDVYIKVERPKIGRENEKVIKQKKLWNLINQ